MKTKRGWLAKTALIMGAASILVLGPVLPANAATPPTGTAAYTFSNVGCSYSTTSGRFVLHGTVRAYVKGLPTLSYTRKYYERIKLTFQDGVSANAQYWHTYDSKTRDGGTFTRRNLPWYSTNGFRSVVGPTLAYNQVFRLRAIVKLKHVIHGPDTTTWRYTAYSKVFTCDTYGVS